MEKKCSVFAVEPDERTLSQFRKCCGEEFVVKGALMPDAHSGYVAPIGSVIVTKGYVVPSWVGFDMGCGMTACRLRGRGIIEKIKAKKEGIFEAVKARVPMGLGNLNSKENVSKESAEKLAELIEKFRKGPFGKEVMRLVEARALKHLGTLGHGNHFIEIGEDEEGEAWIIVHSGSRGIGHDIAMRYMKESAGKEKGYEETFPLKADSEKGKEYLNALDFCLEFALLNRTEIIKQAIGALEEALGKKVGYEVWANRNHNHAVFENGVFIHRKGATPAKKGEKGIIPGNMAAGSFLVIGKGNPDFLESSSHGAGRRLSRKEAKEKFSMKEFKESTKGIKGEICEETLDEAPMAYKDIEEVMEGQRASVEVFRRVRPIINWKGKGHENPKNNE